MSSKRFSLNTSADAPSLEDSLLDVTEFVPKVQGLCSEWNIEAQVTLVELFH